MMKIQRTGLKRNSERKENCSKLSIGNILLISDLQLVPGSHGMNVPSICTIVIIAGKDIISYGEKVFITINYDR